MLFLGLFSVFELEIIQQYSWLRILSRLGLLFLTGSTGYLSHVLMHNGLSYRRWAKEFRKKEKKEKEKEEVINSEYQDCNEEKNNIRKEDEKAPLDLEWRVSPVNILGRKIEYLAFPFISGLFAIIIVVAFHTGLISLFRLYDVMTFDNIFEHDLKILTIQLIIAWFAGFGSREVSRWMSEIVGMMFKRLE